MEDTNWRLLIGGYWLVATNWRHQVRCYRFETMHRLEATDGRPKMGCNILETTDWRPPVRGQSLEVSRFDIFFRVSCIGLSELTIRRPEVGDYVRKLRVELEFQGMITQKWAEKNFGGQGL